MSTSTLLSVEAPAIGIDLGTSNCCVAVLHQGIVHIIENNGKQTTPSCLAFTKNGRLFGEKAKLHAKLDPRNTVINVKRWIGSRNEQRVKALAPNWNYKFDFPYLAVNEDKIHIEVIGKNGRKIQLTAEEVSAMILKKLKTAAERFLGNRVTRAVITVPSSFTDSQRQATINAASIAGLNDLRLINEPTAAAIAYTATQKPSGMINVLVFSMGAGFLDVSVLKINGGAFHVLSTASDGYLGGDDFDHQLMIHFYRELFIVFQKNYVTYIAIHRLKAACEKAKQELSTCSETLIRIDSLCQDFDFLTTITRKKFEEICSNLFGRLLMPVTEALHTAKLKPDAIDHVILVGGSTRIPKVQNILKDFFKGKKVILCESTDVMMAYGAAIQAAFLSGETSVSKVRFLLEELSGYSLDLYSLGELREPIIESNTKLPCSKMVKVKIPSLFKTYTILEGEWHLPMKQLFSQNLSISLIGNSSEPKAGSEVEMIYSIDLNGCLTVTARVEGSGVVKVLRDTNRITVKGIESMKRKRLEYDQEEEMEQRVKEAKDRLTLYAVEVKTACDNAIKWAVGNRTAEEDELNMKLEELQALCASYGFKSAGLPQ